MLKSLTDNYNKKITPVYRKLNDMKIKLLGSKINALILKVTDSNRLGDEDTSVKEAKEIKAHVIYPGEVTIFRNRDSSGQLIDDGAIYMEDILPVELYVTTEDQHTVEEGDILIHILKDENNTAIPQVFRIARALGRFNGKELVYKKFIINNLRDTLNIEIAQAIENYLENQAILE